MTGDIGLLVLFISIIACAAIAGYARANASFVGFSQSAQKVQHARYAARFCALCAVVALALAGLVLFAADVTRSTWVIWTLLLGAPGAGFAVWRVGTQFRARRNFEFLSVGIMAGVAGIAVITTFGIFLTLIFESMLFFSKIPVFDFPFWYGVEPTNSDTL